jgi:hypothetical protein
MSLPQKIPQTQAETRSTNTLTQAMVSFLLTWLRCRHCHAGYFAAIALTPVSCPACADGTVVPISRWGLRTEAIPPGMVMLVRSVKTEGTL